MQYVAIWTKLKHFPSRTTVMLMKGTQKN